MLFNKHIYTIIGIVFYFINGNICNAFQTYYENNSQNITSPQFTIDQCWRYRSSNPQLAIRYCNTAQYALQNNKIDSLECKVLNYSGVVHLNLGNVDSAYYYLQKAVDKAAATKNFKEKGYAYNNFGDYYIYNSNYLLAIENVLKSYTLFDSLKFKKGIAYNLVNLSEIYVKQKKYKKALDSLNAALAIRENYDNVKKVALTKRKMVDVYIEKNELDSALFLLNDIFNDDLIETDPSAKVTYLDALSKIHVKRKAYKDALKLRLEAVDLYRKLGNKKEEVISLNFLGKIYMDLDDYNNAENILLVAEKLAPLINKEIEIENFLLLSKVFKEKKNYEKAYFYLEKYNQLNDSINKKINTDSISDLEQAYSTEKNENQTEVLNEKIKYDKRLRKILVPFLLLLSVLIIYLFYEILTKQNANKKLLASNNAKDRFFSILSHDINGPVTHIKSIADLLKVNLKNANNEELKKLTNLLQLSVNHLTKLISRLIEWSKATTGRTQYNPTNFSINAEIKGVIYMSEDEAIVKNQKLSAITNEDYMVYADQEMVNTILRNLVANAIKFTPKNGFIQLSSFRKNDKIHVLVKDEGIGMTKQVINKIMLKGEINTTKGTDNETGTGLGLSLCKELIKINKGRIWIKSDPGKGSTFYFSLPSAN